MTSELYYLYPRLPQYIAQPLAETLIAQSPINLFEAWATTHETVTFAPTGGNRITQNSLERLRVSMVDIAKQYSYPNPITKEGARNFDIDCGILLHQQMHIHPSEASHNEVWSYLACILLPDIVRWRFEDSDDIIRWVGRERGMRRHVFGRLWWRAYLAHNPKWKEPYILLRLLNEDDFVQITERSSIAVRPILFRTFCVSFARATKAHENLARRDLMREASKRMYRLLSLVVVEALNEKELRLLIDDVFNNTAVALVRT